MKKLVPDPPRFIPAPYLTQAQLDTERASLATCLVDLLDLHASAEPGPNRDTLLLASTYLAELCSALNRYQPGGDS
ncbi:hypothetical protein ACNFIC_14000 [Pseudomonas sp. NY15463]|jgi:hypothetical protein|uniref:hypothetical protein n=1 Tax=Pseudomonas sp. NY15463 TaxID=3400361 RepID=UPI003A872136